MTDVWRRDQLPVIMNELARRPGHEAVRGLIADILRHGFGIRWSDIEHEVRLPPVGGRIDTMFGGTVFEFKRDLRRELADVERKMPDYLAERQRQTGRNFVGIGTDGASFVAYELRNGGLTVVARHETKADQGAALLAWLEPVLTVRDDLPADPLNIQRALGRDSMVFGHAARTLAALWAGYAAHQEAAMKRQLWDRLLREVYGASVGEDGLFLQHTYLTIIAKTIAAAIFDLGVTSAEAILSGRALVEIGIQGAVESDFFDWILLDPDGVLLVEQIVGETRRFRLRDAQTDVLKALYESLMDPEQRHDLGEYYTPDWLAAKLTRAVQTAPLTQRVLDPACGSGTFLFHAVRRLIDAGRVAGIGDAAIVRLACSLVHGMDVHPVAVIFARVTWLLALGPVLTGQRDAISVPVYLGDAMQWNVVDLGRGNEIRVDVPGEQPLTIPGGIAEIQERFEPALQVMTEGLAQNDLPATIERSIMRIPGIGASDANVLSVTYAHLQTLYRAGRDGIWPYVMRNLRRPLWLSKQAQRADVIVGNPPWVAYRFLSAEMKVRVREACQRRGLWVGGVLATQQDLSALFMARTVELYLKEGGRIGFVLPYAALNRPAYEGLRKGIFTVANLRIDEGWSFDEAVKPLFPVPAGVLIGTRTEAGALPGTVTRYAGVLNRRDATEVEADRALTAVVDRWPPIPTLKHGSVYRARFRQGATIVPRRFFIVQREVGGRLGMDSQAPVVVGVAGKLDKKPWSTIDPPRGKVEAQFIRPVLLGESLAPFRLLYCPLAVIPFENGHVLDAADAAAAGYIHLSRWLRTTEQIWSEFSNKDGASKARMTLRKRLDHMRGLTLQHPPSDLRVVYAASGTLPAAVLIQDGVPVIEHKAYWTHVRSREEGHYLCALINAEAARLMIVDSQSKGQGGARDFDNLMWELKIPEYDRRVALHRRLAAAGARAERVAQAVVLDEAVHFTRRRRAIRDALVADGVAGTIDGLVGQLLN